MKTNWIPAFAVMTMLAFAPPTLAQTQPTGAGVASQLQKMMSDPKNSAALGQAIAMGSILGCTQKQAGKEATQKFYQDMTAVGKNVSTYCKEGHATEARALVLSTLEANQSDPVFQAALDCYETEAPKINALAGPKGAAKLAEFHTWAKNPSTTNQQLKESDVCKPKTQNPKLQ